MFIDTHAHVNFSGFKEDAEETIKRALMAGVSVVNVGTQIDTSRQAILMAEKFHNSKLITHNSKLGVYAVIGIHPVHTYSQELDEEETHFKTREEKFNYEEYKKLASNPLVVGIGECGLDYFRLPDNDRHCLGDNDGHCTGVAKIKQMQKDSFIAQAKLAIELDKALVIHTRSSKGTDDACLDVLEILKHELGVRNYEGKDVVTHNSNFITHPFVLHSYTGSPEVAKIFVEIGAYISFNGILTFDKTGNQEAVLKLTPSNRILLETDCPYLTPVPHRGKRNEPLFVKNVAEKVAEVKGMAVEEIENLTTENAKRFYKI